MAGSSWVAVFLICACKHTHTHRHTHTHAQKHTQTHTRTHTHTHAHTHAQTHTQTYAHTHIVLCDTTLQGDAIVEVSNVRGLIHHERRLHQLLWKEEEHNWCRCGCVCMRARMCVYVSVCVYARVCVHAFVCASVYVSVRAYAHMSMRFWGPLSFGDRLI